MTNKPQRVDDQFIKDMRDLAKIRIFKGLANPLERKDISLREMSRLLRRTNGYRIALEEMKTKPKKNE